MRSRCAGNGKHLNLGGIKLSIDKAQPFYDNVVKLIHLCRRTRQEIQIAVQFYV